MKSYWLAAFFLALGAIEVFAQWQVQAIGTQADLRGLCVVSSSVAWIGGTKGTYGRTTDSGKTWSIGTVPDAEKLDFRDVEAFGESIAYLLGAGPGDESRIYKTVDGGKSWTKQFQSTEPKSFFDAFAFWDVKNGLALGDPVDGRFQLIATSDGGEHWNPLKPKTLPPALPGESAFAASGTSLMTRGDKEAWFVTGGGKTARVFHSADRGQTWDVSETPIGAGTGSAGIFSIAFRDAKHGMIVGGDFRNPAAVDANVAVTANGGKTWSLMAKSLPFCSAVTWAKNRWVAVGPSGTHASADDGATWKLLDRAGSNSVGFAATGEGWTAGPKGHVARMAAGWADMKIPRK